MSLTIIVTRDVQPRYRGFLGSAMLELAPGVYISPRLNRTVRDRLWEVLEDWHKQLAKGSIVMVWRERNNTANIAIKILGEPQKNIVEFEGMLLTRREL